MAGKTRFCEICGVKESVRGGFFASFPLDESRCRTWVRLIGKEDLVHLPIEKLHEIRHVCGDHFERRDFGKSGKKLKKRACPKLYLSAPPLSDHQMMEFPQHVASKNISDANLVIPAESLSVQALAVEPDLTPSTSKQSLLTSNAQNISESAAHLDIPAESLPLQTAPVEPEPTPSTSRQPLLTSNTQNISGPSPAKRWRLEIELPRCSGSSENIPGPNRSQQTNQRPDGDMVKNKLIKQLKEMKACIKALKKNAKVLERLESPFLKEIVSLALKNQRRKPRGCRWTTQYKISCLAILKRSPKAYKYLQHLVPVPSIKTLQNILQKVPMEPGISPQILEHLRQVAASYKRNKYCCLLFDEIALKPRVNYNIKRDNVDGYCDMGKSERNDSLADHALVFMLQGIRKKFKQPLAFYFVKGTVSSAKLAEIVKEIVQRVADTGFRVLATVCDQGPTNMGALNKLRDNSPSEVGPSVKNYFHVNENKIYIIYDVPHLFKSIRNNFFNYGEIKMNGKKGKWIHLKLVEEKNRNLLFLSKITPNHTQPKYRAKMKVKNAPQALSNTVSAVLKLLALAESNPQMKAELADTAEIIHQLDKLFDCTNGPSGPDDIKPGLRQNVSKSTNHLSLWAHFRKMIETLSFNNATGVRAKNVRCVQGYLITLCSFRDIWIDLQRLGFKYLNLRQLNQDALENLFGVLRQHSPTNRHPTVTSFVAALITAIVSGLSAPHSRGFNCQKDANVLMTDLHNLIFGSTSSNDQHIDEVGLEKENKENETGECYTLHIPEEEDEACEMVSVENQPVVYVSGYLAMTILKEQTCKTCTESLTVANPDDSMYIYIELREWWADKPSLTYPSISLCEYVQKCAKSFEKDIIPVLHGCNIKNQAIIAFMCNSNGDFIKCDRHKREMFHEITSRLAILLIRRQCKRINYKLSVQEEALADQYKKSEQQGGAK